ncbi:hypothetical protein GCM10027454_09100 [Algoriphagus aestuariicola]
MKTVSQTKLPINFDEIVSAVFTAGPSFYFVLDFFDMSVSQVSSAIKAVHGLDPAATTFNDILELMHPDDLDFVAKAEQKIIEMFDKKIGWDKLLLYKGSYCFRTRMADGSYKLLLHQNLVLTLDEKGGYAKSLNIHTDISHITSKNNYKVSLIGLNGECSYTEMDVISKQLETKVYSKREKEILKLIASGLTSRKISDKLCIALDTVKNHRRNILKKAGVTSTAQLIKESMVSGLL